ncbi:MAG: DUF1553 domain-containing protein, partial [Saprospiraceae bacterium]|nr:DUF1553 domain-containing protein [Saprospiraceae bacterium]
GNQAIVPGNPQASEMMRRITESDPELRMPLNEDPLEDAEIQLLEEWIRQGAKWDEHWSYTSPKSAIPQTDDSWAQTEIDQFILSEMHKHDLQPSPPVASHQLARRAALDITGLPPQPALVRQFMNGEINYASLLDRLLDSPHYGEKWTAMWLDLARYADTKGYEKDGGRNIWRYRDWVINAFNKDLPFDQFTIEQLAGDLLDEPTTDQLIATAFHRNTMTNSEGGTEDEEYRTAAVIDRVNTTFEVWQGMTMACVQCHSHPYDPIRHEDYYRAFALFNNTMDADLDHEFPFISEVRDSIHAADVAEIAEWLEPQAQVVNDAGLMPASRMAEVMMPWLVPALADDIQDVLISRSGSCSNSSYNANNQKNKRYYLLFKDIDLTGASAVKFRVATRGTDGMIQVILDHIGGEVVCEAPLPHTRKIKKGYNEISFPLSKKVQGSRDLLIKLINTTDKLPDGLMDLASVEIVKEEPLNDEQQKRRSTLLASYLAGIQTPVMRKKSAQLSRTTQVFDRGSYLDKTDTVVGGIPALYHYDKPIRNRLDLAHWLVDSENPLTARVYVNRIWNQLFGRGLVLTLDDFGSQTIASPHRDLLDYLAVQFMGEWAWSTKRLIKEILLSSTYQQAAHWEEENSVSDPENQFYTRAPRPRLSAEEIRDQALSISGLITPLLHGPSVMPPQPDGIWKMPYSGEKWQSAQDDQRFRRGLYTYWRRTTPYPSMIAFDSPSREVCVSKRINTNTPLQALVTLNDPVFTEAAQSLGAWMQTQPGSIQEKITAGFERAFYRAPSEEELAILVDLHSSNHTVQGTRSLDAFGLVANTILNLDELLTKG